MSNDEIDYIKNLSIEDVRDFYPEVNEEDYQMMRVIINNHILKRPGKFNDLSSCLIFLLEETIKIMRYDIFDLRSNYRDIKLNTILRK